MPTAVIRARLNRSAPATVSSVTESNQTMESAISRIVDLGETEFGFTMDRPDEWTCGTLLHGEGGFNYTGHGVSPLDAAWALVAELEKAAEFRATYFSRGKS